LTLSIIILSWNTKDLTRNCLRSIFGGERDLDFEVIVVDNASQDGSAEMIEQEFPQVKLIKNKENIGFARGNNQGFQAGRGEYVLFLNSDTIIPAPKTTGTDLVVSTRSVPVAMIEAIKSPPTPLCQRGEFPPFAKEGEGGFKIGALAPKLVYPDGRFQYEFYRKFPNLGQTFWLYLLPMSKLTHKIRFLRKKYLTDINPEKSSFVSDINLPGTALLMPAKLCRELGGWDEGTFYWLEDVDLNLRIIKAGYKLYYLADAEIIHLGGASSALWDDFQKMYNFRKSYLYYFRKHKGGFQSFLVKWLFISNALISSPFLMVLGIFRRKFWQKGIAALKFSWNFLGA
jgi:GT2 family glycosyltransferase